LTAFDNDKTRRAYGRALGSFFAFLEDGGRERVCTSARSTCAPPRPTAFRRHTQAAHGRRAHAVRPTWSPGGVIEHNPALSVKAPRQKLGKGKTPILTAEEAGDLLRSIETDTAVGLRDRALIGVMVFTFARISAACGLNVADLFHQQRRLWVRLHEKGGKFHEMPCHHTLEGYLTEYIERARLGEVARVPLFQAIKVRPYGRGEAALNGERLHRTNVWAMVRRRAKAAGITAEVCNHTFHIDWICPTRAKLMIWHELKRRTKGAICGGELER
jgi:integrase